MFVLNEIFKNALMGIGPVARFARRYHSTGIDSDPLLARRVFDLYKKLQPMVGKEVLEIGPGHTMDVLEEAIKSGATSCTAVDVAAYLSQAEAEQKGIVYEVYDGRKLPFPSRRFDVIVSHTAFEHLRYPLLTVQECYRVLRDGGSMMAVIDLGDHSYYGLAESQPNKLFDCLRYPEWLWKLMKWNRSSYVNRLRKSEWIALFGQEGFAVRKEESCVSEQIVQALPRLHYLHKYRHDDAVTAVLTVWLEKPKIDRQIA
jgi:ubiquinone/menaquinone biosynthesis C-methylase UbiE